MTDYIKREDAIAVFGDIHPLDYNASAYANKIKAIPAADVAPVVHGRWKPMDLSFGRSFYYCTCCEETVDMPTALGVPMFRYCPNCGAAMDLEDV